ncbi:carbohydrate ABC transporter permease [Candidatus Zixiibacteriota bacterium]
MPPDRPIPSRSAVNTSSPIKRRRTGTFGLLLPWLLTFAVFWLYPLAHSAFLSLNDYNPLTGALRFVGGQHFIQLLSDPDFLNALKNTFVFVLGTVPVTTTIALLLALGVNRKLPWRGLFRAGFFVPTLTATVVVALLFIHLYTQGGYLHTLARMLGVAEPNRGLLLSEKTALLSVMAMDIWVSVGYYMLLFLAGLQQIPRDLYDQADLCGASAWQKLRWVTLPLLKPITLYVVLINTIKSFQIFTEIFVMTQGGPVGATSTVVYFVYREGFEKFRMGYASAAAYVLFFVILIISIAQARFFGFFRRAER